ncbi:hypothetical protein C9J85_12880 [Haloferax sp. wsp5]|nr:hypothetical protein C9J85_12880 [Haloferax sp. wsp5]
MARSDLRSKAVRDPPAPWNASNRPPTRTPGHTNALIRLAQTRSVTAVTSTANCGTARKLRRPGSRRGDFEAMVQFPVPPAASRRPVEELTNGNLRDIDDSSSSGGSPKATSSGPRDAVSERRPRRAIDELDDARGVQGVRTDAGRRRDELSDRTRRAGTPPAARRCRP